MILQPNNDKEYPSSMILKGMFSTETGYAFIFGIHLKHMEDMEFGMTLLHRHYSPLHIYAVTTLDSYRGDFNKILICEFTLYGSTLAITKLKLRT